MNNKCAFGLLLHEFLFVCLLCGCKTTISSDHLKHKLKSIIITVVVVRKAWSVQKRKKKPKCEKQMWNVVPQLKRWARFSEIKKKRNRYAHIQKKKERNLVNNNKPQTKKKTTLCANATQLNAKHCVLTAGFQHKLFFAFQLNIKKKKRAGQEFLSCANLRLLGFLSLKWSTLFLSFCVCARSLLLKWAQNNNRNKTPFIRNCEKRGLYCEKKGGTVHAVLFRTHTRKRNLPQM